MSTPTASPLPGPSPRLAPAMITAEVEAVLGSLDTTSDLAAVAAALDQVHTGLAAALASIDRA